jgi:hypothetical protein
MVLDNKASNLIQYATLCFRLHNIINIIVPNMRVIRVMLINPLYGKNVR